MPEECQRGDGGDLLIVLAPLPKHRGVPAQTPGAAHQGSHEHAGFVEENDGCIQARGVFFTRGQSCSIQAWMRSSSRSKARRVGFCGEKPNPCRPPPRSHTRKLNEMHIGLLGEQGMVLYCRSQRRHIDSGQVVYEKC
ncbi:MAG: hypothetical protein JWO52_5309, partial [Gammaproteobacteria bacterium]|nr:hypothetical protein [Gammaproteobacteria bacterium]